MNMAMISTNCEQDKLQRLVDHVERRQLHRAGRSSCPRAWLVQWLATPREDLNWLKPATFLAHEDFDLILVGLLIRSQTSREWR